VPSSRSTRRQAEPASNSKHRHRKSHGTSDDDTADKLRKNTKYQFYLGPPLSGAPFHSHGPAFNGLVFGQKLWFLLPPGHDLYTSIHPLRWLLNKEYIRGMYASSANPDISGEQKKLGGPCVIVQNPGEVMYIPRHWSHQVSSVTCFVV
jgi:hypothetical protein